MSATTTTISWCDRTWNPLRGCSLVSAGCTHCYAMRQAGRFSGPGQPYEGLVRKTRQGYTWTGDVRLIEKDMEAPLRWKTPARIFVNSMSDLFHENVEEWWQDRIFAVMALAHWHTFQILTKRPELMRAYFESKYLEDRISTFATEIISRYVNPHARLSTDLRATYDDELWPLPNVWLGVSCENQATANERIPWLLKTPAAVRFVSYEPVLEPVDLAKYTHFPLWGGDGQHSNTYCKICFKNYGPHPRIDWLIVGGESGPKARYCEIDWLRSIVKQCAAADVACWVKQLGALPCIDGAELILHDRKGANPAEWPEDLRVQHFPDDPLPSPSCSLTASFRVLDDIGGRA